MEYSRERKRKKIIPRAKNPSEHALFGRRFPGSREPVEVLFHLSSQSELFFLAVAFCLKTVV